MTARSLASSSKHDPQHRSLFPRADYPGPRGLPGWAPIASKTSRYGPSEPYRHVEALEATQTPTIFDGDPHHHGRPRRGKSVRSDDDRHWRFDGEVHLARAITMKAGRAESAS
jgi:hypothetical protein